MGLIHWIFLFAYQQCCNIYQNEHGEDIELKLVSLTKQFYLQHTTFLAVQYFMQRVPLEEFREIKIVRFFFSKVRARADYSYWTP